MPFQRQRKNTRRATSRTVWAESLQNFAEFLPLPNVAHLPHLNSGTLNSVNVLEPSQKSVQLHASNHLKSLLDFRHPEAGELGRGKSSFPYPHPLLIFDRRPPPRYKLISLPSLKLPLKLKMTAIIFVMKLLSTRSPKLRLLYRLTHI